MSDPSKHIFNQVDTNNFKKISIIKRGGFSIVYKIEDVEKHELYAAKVIIGDYNKEEYKRMIDREIGVLIMMNHPTIIKFIGYSMRDFNGENNATIVMQMAQNGSLADILELIQKVDGPKQYNNTSRQIILVGIARGMKYLHDRNVVHRDLKPGNVLLDENFYPIITDFGLSKFFRPDQSDTLSQACGTLIYLAPEVIESTKYDPLKADVYSFAILMFEVLTDSFPYPELKEKKINNFEFLNKVVNSNYRPNFNVNVKESLKKLIIKCWSPNPNNRPTFTEIFNMLSMKDDGDKYLIDDDVDVDELMDYIDIITQPKDKINELLNKLEEIQKEKINLSNMNKQLNERNEQLKNDYAKLMENCEQLNKENKEKNIGNKQQNENYLLLQRNYEILDSQYKQLKEDFNLLKKEKNQQVEENCQLKKDYEKLVKCNDKIKKEENKLNEDIQQLDKENIQLIDENRIMKDDNKQQLIFENEKLKNENHNQNLTEAKIELVNNVSQLNYNHKKNLTTSMYIALFFGLMVEIILLLETEEIICAILCLFNFCYFFLFDYSNFTEWIIGNFMFFIFFIFDFSISVNTNPMKFIYIEIYNVLLFYLFVPKQINRIYYIIPSMAFIGNFIILATNKIDENNIFLVNRYFTTFIYMFIMQNNFQSSHNFKYGIVELI